MADLPLAEVDPEIAQCIADEERRQHDKLRLIPSENYASRAVMEACGSVLNNKYSEGYAGKRYYEGQQNIDTVEKLVATRHLRAVLQLSRHDSRVVHDR
jgi:glycine hydroxymethyltransferase